MKKPFLIYIDGLKDGRKEPIKEEIPPAHLNIKEETLRFEKPISLEGEAYLTGKHLIVALQIQTESTLLCRICENWFPHPIVLQHFCHAEPLENISNGVYDYSKNVREELLVESPFYAECQNNCPRRKDLEPYLSSKKTHLDLEGSKGNCFFNP